MFKILFSKDEMTKDYRTSIAYEYGVFSMFLSLISVILFYFINKWMFSTLHLALTLILLIGLVQLRNNHSLLAKLMISLFSPLILFLDGLFIFGPEANTSYFFFTMLVVSFLIFDRTIFLEKWILNGIIAIIPLLAISSHLIQLSTAPFSSQTVYIVNITALLFTFFSMSFLLGRHFKGATLFQATLYKEAKVDFLTKIFNRRYFQENGQQLFNQSKKYLIPMSVIIFDIDFFKAINDSYGHPFGDKVLREVCKTISKKLRAQDIFARYGGEEFAILLYNTPSLPALSVAEKLQESMAHLKVSTDDGTPIPIQASFGITSTDIREFKSFDELVKEADRALYQAKNSGRNKIQQSIG